VLDVSFELKAGQPLYAVRTYANGKVWDGLIDGTTAAAARGCGDGGILVGRGGQSRTGRIEKRQDHAAEAIASAEKEKGGRALNAGLEQVRGHAVWEILVQEDQSSRQVHVDPATEKIL
jgi:uncharacterized membrane protein YkoI